MSRKEYPLITISTVVFNEKAIEKTILSVLPFLGDPRVEYVVVDGGSTDGTLELLERYKDRISILVSEPDNGIYDAMNKAARLASGTYLLHLNAGDTLLRLPFGELEKCSKDPYCAVVSYPCQVGKRVFVPHSDWHLKIMNTLHHQSTFYRRELVVYDTVFRVFADYDLNQKLYYQKKLLLCLPETLPVAIHDTSGIASGGKHRWESYRVLRKNSGMAYLLFYFLYRAWAKWGKRVAC